MKITPSARILRMLGEIEFAEWQCLAELVDNSFDDFSEVLDLGTPWAGGFRVSVSLPKAGQLSDAEVVVRDTGRGMTRDRLEQAVRAGWSSNDQFDKLGLFGMGFNVSTARLGRRTRVLTTRAGDSEWIGVEIDLDEIGDDFEAPDITEPKADPSEHGTRIEISRLDRDRADWLQRNSVALRRQLGHVYGWILEHRPFELWVNGLRVTPRKPCHWSPERSVIFGTGAKAEEIPAVIQIDQTYAPADTCLVCGNWQQTDLEACTQCNSPDLRRRERRVHGWLGIQRYLDRSEYGVDFLRNGRKILMNDKGIFEWSDPNNPMAALLVEYPTELGQGGRIIGEIHLDHVPVTYQKNAFEFSDRQWKQALVYLRGDGPLLPQKAKELNYPENTSPLGKLIKGYRRNDPGFRYLTPGDGRVALNDRARVWAEKFYAGESDYQSDDLWWKQVVLHEEVKRAGVESTAKQVAGNVADEAEVLSALGLTEQNASSNSVSESKPGATPQSAETAFERAERYRTVGAEVPALCGELGSPDVGFVKVTTRLLDEAIMGAQETLTPVWVESGKGGTVDVFVDRTHDLFSRFGWSARDAMLIELAGLLKVQSDSKLSTSAIVNAIQSASLPDSAVDIHVVATEGRELLSEIRDRMADQIAGDPRRGYQWLTSDEVVATENAMIASGARKPGPLADDPRFVTFTPPLFVARLVEEWPEAFMDGLVFRGPYADLESKTSQRLAVRAVTSLLADVAQLTSALELNQIQLQRCRLSVLLLREEVSTPSE